MRLLQRWNLNVSTFRQVQTATAAPPETLATIQGFHNAELRAMTRDANASPLPAVTFVPIEANACALEISDILLVSNVVHEAFFCQLQNLSYRYRPYILYFFFPFAFMTSMNGTQLHCTSPSLHLHTLQVCAMVIAVTLFPKCIVWPIHLNNEVIRILNQIVWSWLEGKMEQNCCQTPIQDEMHAAE